MPYFPGYVGVVFFATKNSKSAQRSQRKCSCSECALEFQSSFAPFALKKNGQLRPDWFFTEKNT
jgi:hypothetical protein